MCSTHFPAALQPVLFAHRPLCPLQRSGNLRDLGAWGKALVSSESVPAGEVVEVCALPVPGKGASPVQSTSRESDRACPIACQADQTAAGQEASGPSSAPPCWARGVHGDKK